MPAPRDLGRIFRLCRCIRRGHLNEVNGGSAWAVRPAGRSGTHAPRQPACRCVDRLTRDTACDLFVCEADSCWRSTAACGANCHLPLCRFPPAWLSPCSAAPTPAPSASAPLQGLPYSLEAFESFDYNLRAELSIRARS